jgi:DNA-binding IclR family transcriptional regulator
MSRGLERNSTVQSVDRAVFVLEFLSREGWSGVTEVASKLEIHKSTAHRLLATLKAHGLVEQSGTTELYRLGLGMVVLGNSVTAELDLVRTARPICQRLCDDTHETVTLTILVGDRALVIDQISAPSSVLSVNWTGQRTPLHCTSDGKVLLAHLPKDRQSQLLAKPLERHTPRTIVDPIHLREQLQVILTEGYGFTVEELEIGLNAVAAPIRSVDGTVQAAVGVSGPTFRLPDKEIPRMGHLTAGVAATISQRLGYAGVSNRPVGASGIA